MFLMLVSPTVSLKKRASTMSALTILSRGITSSSRPNLGKYLQNCLSRAEQYKEQGDYFEFNMSCVLVAEHVFRSGVRVKADKQVVLGQLGLNGLVV